MTWGRLTVAFVALALLATAPAALADFPYMPAGGDRHNPSTWKLPPGTAPNDFSESNDWKLAATPESSPQSATVNSKQDELCGIRGASIVDTALVEPTGCAAGQPVKTAWQVTLGRPDVTIAVLDSGIEWNDPQAMADLRDKVHLNQGELPAPRHDLSTPLVAGQDCSKYAAASGADFDAHANYDVNGDGVFNVVDYACDSRVGAAMHNPLRHGPDGVLTPEDLILAFSDGADHDRNGFANDIAGWNFVDNNNDPFDDVQYGHGTGEARDSNAEANNGGGLGTCPDCTVLPLRVGESFIADSNRFAQAVLYATDSGASVVQEALGTLNESYFTRQAIDYAYDHGVAVIASAADEAAEHHNQPGALPHTIIVNSVVKYDSQFSFAPPSYLQFNGCTNFSTKVTLAVPSSSCSSEATGKSAGVAGLIYSAALNARDAGTLSASGDCTRVDGSRCVITPNEVRQLLASGDIGSTQPADAGSGQADDVNFAQQPEPSCAQAPVPTCTDPNHNTVFAADENAGLVGPLPDTRRYPARRGFDEFYGYGRLNGARSVAAAAAATIPPEADITSPDWFQQVDPGRPTFELDGYVNARVPYTCRVYVAPGGQPNNATTTDSPPGDFEQVGSSYCDGSSVHSGGFRGALAQVDVAHLRGRFPSGNPGSFDGPEPGGIPQDSNGRPNTMPYAFTVRVVVTTAQGTAMSGEDRRQLFLHRDRDMLPGFPKELRTDGASSPLLVDLDGDNRNELVVATSDGWVHAYRPNGSELRGFPVHSDSLPLHPGERAYGSGGVGAGHYGAILGALAAGDLFHDGRIEIVADDNDGKVYAWDSRGRLVFHQEANRAYSGAPLVPFHTVRQGPRDRTEHGFLASPVLADLDGEQGLDIVAAGEDRHVYAWHPNGKPVKGFPLLVVDPDKVASVDPTTNHVTFNSHASAKPGIDEDQGKIIDTPGIADLGSGHPSIVVGTNEEYATDSGDEGGINAGGVSTASLGVIGQTGLLSFANGRVYAIKHDGSASGKPFEAGWPKKVGIIDRGLLPDVGEGVNGSPVVAPLTCQQGGGGMKIGVSPDAGPAYIFNADGSSCYGQSNGADNALATDFAAGGRQYDHPAFPAVGYPTFGSFDGRTISLFAPVAGLIRALDVVAPEYQGGQDFVGGWDTASGQYSPGWPSEVNDLQFLTGPAVGQVTAGGGQSVVDGTASLDLAAIGSSGQPASGTWPKLTGDWTIATPTLGSFGTLDTAASAHKDVVSITRLGTLSVYTTPAPACSPSSSPRFHHDDANSGDYTRDAVMPGVPTHAHVSGHTLTFTAPGSDLMCGKVSGYEVVTSKRPITPQRFAHATRLRLPKNLALAAPGSRQTIQLPARQRYIAVRAEGSQNRDYPRSVGLPALVDTVGHCIDRRHFVFTFHHARGARVVHVVIYVNGRKALDRRGTNIVHLRLPRPPIGRFKVKIVATQSTGAKLISTRTYVGCRQTTPHTRARHHHRR